MDLKMNFEACTHYGDPTYEYDSSSSSNLVIDTNFMCKELYGKVLAPLQVGANLHIRAPPLHRRQLTQSRNSN